MAGTGDIRSARARRRRLSLVLALAACVTATSLVAVPAVAQDEEPPPEPLTLDVARYVVPNTRAKLIERGVLVKARCNVDCVIVVKLRLPRDVADELGIKRRTIGAGAAGAKANQYRWVRARVSKAAARLLADYEGDGRLEIRIRALP
jgi:hypothetical protein